MIKLQNYNDRPESLKNKYIYMKRSNKEMDILYIFYVKDIVVTNPLTIKTNQQYYFCIPFAKERHCYYYESQNKIILDDNDILYELSGSEWVSTYMSFIDNEAKFVYELPSNVIKNNRTV